MAWSLNATGDENGGPCAEATADGTQQRRTQTKPQQSRPGQKLYFRIVVFIPTGYDGDFEVGCDQLNASGEYLSTIIATIDNSDLVKNAWQELQGPFIVSNSGTKLIEPFFQLPSNATTGTVKTAEYEMGSEIPGGVSFVGTKTAELIETQAQIAEDLTTDNGVEAHPSSIPVSTSDRTFALSHRDGVDTWWESNKGNFNGVTAKQSSSDGFYLEFDASLMDAPPFFMWSKYPILFERDEFGEYEMSVQGWCYNDGLGYDLELSFGPYCRLLDGTKTLLAAGAVPNDYFDNDLGEMNNTAFASLYATIDENDGMSALASYTAEAAFVQWGFVVTNYHNDDPDYPTFYLRGDHKNGPILFKNRN